MAVAVWPQASPALSLSGFLLYVGDRGHHYTFE